MRDTAVSLPSEAAGPGMAEPDQLASSWCAAEPRLLAVALRFVRDREVARDVVQSAFVKAFVHRASFRGDARPATWFHRIVVNEAAMWLRSERRRERRTSDVPCSELVDPRPPLDASLDHARHLRAALRAIEALPAAQRDMVQECFVGGMSYERFARRSGEHTEAVKTRAFRARRALREAVGDR